MRGCHNVAGERHTLFEKMVTSSKESVITKVLGLVDLFSKEVTKLYKFYGPLKDIVGVLFGSTRTLIEYIRAFNKEYVGEMKLKMESDSKAFTNIKNSILSFHVSL